MARKAIQYLGGNSYINEFPTGLLLREAKRYEIGAGTSEIGRMLIGRELYRYQSLMASCHLDAMRRMGTSITLCHIKTSPLPCPDYRLWSLAIH